MVENPETSQTWPLFHVLGGLPVGLEAERTRSVSRSRLISLNPKPRIPDPLKDRQLEPLTAMILKVPPSRPQYRPQNILILIIGIPKKAPPNFRNYIRLEMGSTFGILLGSGIAE